MLTFDKLVPSAKKDRFAGIHRTYEPNHVLQLRGSLQIHHTLAEHGANRLWDLLHGEPFVAALGAAIGETGLAGFEFEFFTADYAGFDRVRHK